VKNDISILVQAYGESNQWDLFLKSIPEPPFEQSSAWAYARQIEGWNSCQILLRQNAQVVAGVQVLTWQLSKLGTIGIVPQGPCFSEEGWHYRERLVAFVKQWVKKERLLYLVWDINYRFPELPELLQGENFHKKIKSIPPQPVIEASLVLDLTPDMDTLFSQFRRDRRKNIRRGLKQSFLYRVGQRSDLETFFSLMISMCRRRQTKPTNSNIQFFYRLWDALTPGNGISLHLLDYNDKTVCAMLCFNIGDTFRAFKWGWTGEYAGLNITHVLYWKTIEWAKEKGFKKYDFVQVDPDVAEVFLSGGLMSEELKNRSFYGPTIHKMCYTGDFVTYPGVYMYVPKSAFRIMIAFSTRFKFVQQLLNWVIKKVYGRKRR